MAIRPRVLVSYLLITIHIGYINFDPPAWLWSGCALLKHLIVCHSHKACLASEHAFTMAT